jgi:hypothetical protein
MIMHGLAKFKNFGRPSSGDKIYKYIKRMLVEILALFVRFNMCIFSLGDDAVALIYKCL